VRTNEGNGYNPSTGIFTAPDLGIYNFQCTVLAVQRTSAYVALYINGALIVRNHAPANGARYTTTNTLSMIVKLKKGDKVWIQKYHDTLKLYGSTFSSFQGFKM